MVATIRKLELTEIVENKTLKEEKETIRKNLTLRTTERDGR